ncbi:aspartate aminotransferase family protein (plasmid) [Pseudomonas sp. MPC6]|nr:aspartate aminotransferase family protein [Pseudomonas sp. MPC6]
MRCVVHSINREKTLELYTQYLHKHKLPVYKQFNWEVVEGRREGAFIWDMNGKRYFDCHTCGGTYNLGHRNPEVINAVKNALDHLDLGNHHLPSPVRALLAEQLVKSAGETPDGEKMGRVMWASGGGEAMDFAFKMARGYTRKNKILCLDGGYHGHTGLAMGAGDKKYTKAWNTNPPDFVKVPWQDLGEIEKYFDDDTAAVTLESIPATLGMTIIPRKVMQHIRKVTKENGILMILDEIQTGMGRSGKTWCFHHYGIMPDIFAIGKGFSGGVMPSAATIYRDEMEQVFAENPLIHFSSFGGNEISCAASSVALTKATDPECLAYTRKLAAFFREEFDKLRQETDKIAGLRQLGLFQAIEYKDVATCISAVERLNNNGVFCLFSNNDRISSQFMPPLTLTMDEARELMDLVRKSVNEAESFDLEGSDYFKTQTESRIKNVLHQLD